MIPFDTCFQALVLCLIFHQAFLTHSLFFYRKGISQSALPYRRSVPTWLKLSGDDVQEQIYKLAKKGLTPSQIGKTIFSVLLPKFPIRILYLSNSDFHLNHALLKLIHQAKINIFSSICVKNLYFLAFMNQSCYFMNGCLLSLIHNFFIS